MEQHTYTEEHYVGDEAHAPSNLPTGDNHDTHGSYDIHNSHNDHQNDHSGHDSHDNHSDHSLDEHSEEKKNSALYIRIAVIVGILIILFFISISIVQFVPRMLGGASSFFSSLFGGGPKITISTDKPQARSGDPITFTWKNSSSDTSGQYTWQFTCTDGAAFFYQSTNGLKPVVCNTLFPLPTNGNSYTFVGSSSKETNITVPITISQWGSDNKVKLSATSNLTLVPKNAPTNTNQAAAVNLSGGYANSGTATSSNSQSYSLFGSNYSDATTSNQWTTLGYPNGGQTTSDQNTNTNNGYYQPVSHGGSTNGSNSGSNTSSKSGSTASYGTSPDLAINLTKVGFVDNNGNLISGNSIPTGSKVLVQFTVSSIGNAPSGTWYLSANLPTGIFQERTYTSSAEPSLRPGSSYQMTLTFDNFDPSQGNLSLSITGASDINSANNTLSVPLSSNGNYNGGGYNPYYPNNGYNNGPANLSLRITDVGVMDSYGNSFYYSNTFHQNDRIGVRFTVTNTGGSASGPWSFQANLPAVGNSNYNSGTEPSLAPGQSTQFTIAFTGAQIGSDNIQVYLNNNNGYGNYYSNSSDSRTIYVSY